MRVGYAQGCTYDDWETPPRRGRRWGGADTERRTWRLRAKERMCDYIIGAPLVLSFVIIILATPPHQPVINRSGFEWGQVRPVPFVLLVPKALC